VATDAVVLEDAPVGDPAPTAFAAPASNDPRGQCLAKVNFGDLPGTAGAGGDETRGILLGSFEPLVGVFAAYCRVGNESATIEDVGKLGLAGFKKLIKDTSGLEVQGMGAEAMSGLFARFLTGQPEPKPKAAAPAKGPAKGSPAAKGAADKKPAADAGPPAIPPEQVQLQLHEFLGLLVRLVFLRQNPRYGRKESKGTAAPEVVPVARCLAKFVAETLPSMGKGSRDEFRKLLKANRPAQAVLQEYSEKVQAWHARFHDAAAAGGAGEFAQWAAQLQEAGCLEKKTIDVEGTTLTSNLTPLQARLAFLDAHEAEECVMGTPGASLGQMLEAIARCGDVKYTRVDKMDFAARVRGMLQNLLAEASEEEVVAEAMTAAAPAPGAAAPALDSVQAEALHKKWLSCWRTMLFKDLVGYPMWETELHDVLKAAFPELQSIFLFYCGSSIAGAGSIASATKIGIMEYIAFGKDAQIITKEYKADEFTRHFAIANSLEAMKASGSVERNQKGGKNDVKGRAANGGARAVGTDPIKAAKDKRKPGADVPDQQLNLSEFINCLVRVGFSRYNPQWGSKYNKKELTPVPLCVQMFLNDIVLPNAKRDTSSAFKLVLANDKETQAVLNENREKLQTWLRPILRKARTASNPNPTMTYDMWVALMDGPDPETRDVRGPKPPCPKMVGEWRCSQESEITGDERVGKKQQLHFKAALSIPQVRWNFLRSQSIDQQEIGEVDAEKSDAATLDFGELIECIARCAVNMYSQLMEVHLPSHNRLAMSMADAVRAFIRVLLWEDSVEMTIYQQTLIRAERFEYKKFSRMPQGMDPTMYKLFLDVWGRMPLMDVHGFPLWEKGVHDCLVKNFPALMRIFANYTKGISGIDSAADALEMELEEFHDFVKDSKLETKLLNFTAMTNVFAKANAENTAEAYALRQMGKRNSAVQAEVEAEKQAAAQKKGGVQNRLSSKPGAFPELPDRFAPDYPVHGSSKNQKPDNRLVLAEFIACLVRISFVRANPKFGQYDNKGKTIMLPTCLETCLEQVVIPNAKQDLSSLFRDELAANVEVQMMLRLQKPKLQAYFEEITKATSLRGKPGRLTMEAWVDICKGNVRLSRASKKPQKGGMWGKLKASVISDSDSENALVGDYMVRRESEITGDERAREKFACRLTLLEAKFAFLNSQGLDQMTAGDAENDDAMATLDYDEFVECVCRCGRDKYNEVKPMTLTQGIMGFIQNMLAEKGEEAVMRDNTYIKADRYDWKLSKPLNGQKLAAHRKWLDCWQAMSLGDLHYFPTWEKEVHDVLQEAFGDLVSIFAFYSKSVGGSTTAEDAVEMTMTEFKDIVRDVGLETKDLKFDVMCNLFMAANAINKDDAHAQRMESKKSSASKQEGKSEMAGKGGSAKSKSSKAIKDDEMDKELVLYEFVELLTRISFWRANPYHGIIKLAGALVPFPDCLSKMLHEVVLPNAQRDDSALFKEKLESDEKMQAVLKAYEEKLRAWFNGHTQSQHLRGEERRIGYDQWQEILKKGKVVGIWEVHRESEITGDPSCRDRFKCSLSMPQAKFAFMNSQSLDQMSAGGAGENQSMTTLSFSELIECVARCGCDKYKPVREMSEAAAIKGTIQNLLGELNEEEVMVGATKVTATRYDWQRYSKPLDGQPLAAHQKWLEVYQRIEIQDIHQYPLWEEGVHDVLQKHFADLGSIFLAYCKSIGGSGSAEDAMEMEMGEFQDFVNECGLITKETSFALMTNTFIKANATNSAAVREQHAEGRRNAASKEGSALAKGGKAPKKEIEKVKGTSDGKEAKKDQELVLYEFIAMLVRISFQRANPTFGNFGDTRAIVGLPGCLETMLEEFVLPNARRDTSAQFRETVMKDAAVIEVLERYEEKLKEWYTKVCADDTKENVISDKLGMRQILDVFDDRGHIGQWDVHQESDISGDPRTRIVHKWKLSIPTVKSHFMDSQSGDKLGAAQADATDEGCVLDFGEFQECVARCGLDKYRPIKAMTPAAAVQAMLQNLVGEKTEEEAVVAATYIRAERFDASASAQALPGEGQKDVDKWLDTWGRMALMDIFQFPTWEQEVHDIMQPLFKDLQAIFLAYCRSISEVSAEDALEMSLEEFHDFVVDVGLETPKYKFDVMTNQFIKANATNTAAAYDAHRQARANADAQTHAGAVVRTAKTATAAGAQKVATATRDQELVLYEFLAMLVRISFWRCNPSFGLFGIKDEIKPVPMALSEVLNEVILPKAKRETSAQFRDSATGGMKDPTVLDALKKGREKVAKWYKDTTSNDADEDVISDKIGFTEWMRVCNRQDLVGTWTVEQMSAITGDTSCSGEIQCRLSVPQIKAAFMDSQSGDKLAVGQADVLDDTATLDFEEFQECIARCAIAKYRAVKAMKPGACVTGFIANLTNELTTEQVMQDATYIKAERFDVKTASNIAGQPDELFKRLLATWGRLDLQGLHGFPVWEGEVFQIVQQQYGLLSNAFKAYSKGLGDSANESQTMDMDEFKDFVVDCGLETERYKFAQMGIQFARANSSGKGAAGPAADAELMLHEFIAMIVRIAFWRVNPGFGAENKGREEAMSHSDFTPVPNALRIAMNQHIVPNAQTGEDAAKFKTTVMREAAVQEALEEGKDKLLGWFTRVDLDPAISSAKLGIAQWVKLLGSHGATGDFTCVRGSDIVGDTRAGTQYQCRLSVPQAKAAFLNSQSESGAPGDVEATLLDFEELVECCARCGVDKYRTIKEMDNGARVAGFIDNLTGEKSEEQVITDATYISAERFDAAASSSGGGDAAAWLKVWAKLGIEGLHGFPLWEKGVHDALLPHFGELQSIFRAYSCGTIAAGSDGADEMDLEEFHDFAVECGLPTKEYGFNVMATQFSKADATTKDKVLVLSEFIGMLVRIAFFRANPQYGNAKQKDAPALVELPECLVGMLAQFVLPSARRDVAALFKTTTLVDADVQAALSESKAELAEWYQKAKGGRPTLTLDEWVKLLQKRMLFGEFSIAQHTCRLTVSQAKAAFIATPDDPQKGLTEEQLLECVARCGVDKYKGVAPMPPAAAVKGFIQNLLGKANEEQVVKEFAVDHHL